MPESSLARRLSPQQCEHLAALGVELLELRPRGRGAATIAVPTAPGDVAGPRFRLCVRVAEASRQAPLLQSMIRALGLHAGEVAYAEGIGLPTLAFAPDVDQGVNAPALEQLRLSAGKRALWPALRRLRRQLSSTERSG